MIVPKVKQPAKPKLDGRADDKSDGKVVAYREGQAGRAKDGRADGRVSASRVATVSHTLESSLAERLREFAFRERISESAVIEHALVAFFAKGDDATLGAQLRKLGAALRRKI